MSQNTPNTIRNDFCFGFVAVKCFFSLVRLGCGWLWLVVVGCAWLGLVWHFSTSVEIKSLNDQKVFEKSCNGQSSKSLSNPWNWTQSGLNLNVDQSTCIVPLHVGRDSQDSKSNEGEEIRLSSF